MWLAVWLNHVISAAVRRAAAPSHSESRDLGSLPYIISFFGRKMTQCRLPGSGTSSVGCWRWSMKMGCLEKILLFSYIFVHVPVKVPYARQ